MTAPSEKPAKVWSSSRTPVNSRLTTAPAMTTRGGKRSVSRIPIITTSTTAVIHASAVIGGPLASSVGLAGAVAGEDLEHPPGQGGIADQRVGQPRVGTVEDER